MVKSLDEIQKISADWEQSGEDQKTYCWKRSISYGQFTQWRSKLIKTGLSKSYWPNDRYAEMNTEPSFVPIDIKKTQLDSESDEAKSKLGHITTEQSNRIEIHLPYQITISMPAHAAE